MVARVPSRIRSGEVVGLADLLVAGPGEGVRGALLTGVPGVGKSTTLDALGRVLLGHGVDARRVAADDFGRQRPFGVVSDLLGLDLGYPPRPDTIDQVVGALESLGASGPVALCIDDAHRADPDSLEVIARLHRFAPDLPVVVVLARRTTPERAALSALALRGDVAAVEVVGLDVAGRDALVRGRYGAAPGDRLRSLVAEADGNPFRLHSLLDELDRRGDLSVAGGVVDVIVGALAVPTSVEAGVRAHLGLLDPRARELLQVLAVWGRATDLATLAAVGRVPEHAVVEPVRLAVDAGLLHRTDDEQVAFPHDLYRDAVLADLDPSVRSVLHAASAAELRRRGAGSSSVARHTVESEGVDTATTALRAAADLEHAPAQAAELLGQAAAQLAGDGEGADALAVERAGALAISGQVEAAEHVARRRLAESRDPATHAELRRLVLFCLVSGAQVDAALDEIASSAQRAPAGAAQEALADVRRWITLLGGRGTVGEGPVPVAVSGSGLVTDALELFLGARCQDGYERAVMAAGVRVEHRSRPWLDSPTAPVWPAFLALYLHGPGRARELSLDARRVAQKAGRLWLTPYHQSVSAGINVMAGAWDDALAELESALEAAEATGTAWTSLPTASLLQIQVRRGDLDAAETALRRWRTRALPEQFGLPLVGHAEVLLLEAREQAASAAEVAGRAWRRAVDRGRRIWPLLVGPDVLRVAAAAGDDDLVARIIEDTAAVPGEQAAAVRPARRLVAAVAARAPIEAAGAALDYRAVGNVLGEITAWEEAACLAAAAGEPDQARTSAARCTTLAASLGAVTVERRLAARLRRLEVRLGARGARRRPTTGWESLTPTELRIAELVGQGLTSPQVAARLYISPRTVQTHISHILRKLQLRSRVELAAGISRRGRI